MPRSEWGADAPRKPLEDFTESQPLKYVIVSHTGDSSESSEDTARCCKQVKGSQYQAFQKSKLLLSIYKVRFT